MLELQFSSQARDFLKKIESSLWARIINRIEKLRSEPFPKDTKRVKGIREKTFRIRVGDYRILYMVYPERNLLFISKVEKRARVYD